MPIHIATYWGNLEVVETLVMLGEDVDVVSDFHKFTPLIFAAVYGHADVAKYLVRRGADIDIEDEFGRDALDWAVAENEWAVAAEILHD